MNMNDDPQIAESASMTRSRRVTARSKRIYGPSGSQDYDSIFLATLVQQPLHRALGLTDGELERIHGLLERDPNHFELAVFSLLWSKHSGYKHSARC